MSVVFEIERDGVSLKGYLSDDQLKLYLDISREPEAVVGLVFLTDLLAEHVKSELLSHGVLRDIIKTLENETVVERRRIATGSAPQPGRDGKLLLLVKKLQEQPEMKADERGAVDMTALHLFENIRAGQVIGRIYPPAEGIPGISAIGDEIPAAAGAVQGVVLEESISREPAERTDVRYEILRATCDGLLEESGGKLRINPELSISGDLDHRVGTVEFVGRVVVGGDVQKGYAIRAEKGITVRGNVYQSSLYSKAGDIRVEGVIFSDDSCRIIGAGDFYAKAISGAHIEVLGNVFIEEEIRNSLIRCAKTVCAREARAFGGEILCASGFEIGELGTEKFLSCTVRLSSDIETSSEYAALEVSLQNHLNALKLIESHLGPYAKNSDRVKLLNESLREKMERLLAKRISVAKGIVSLEEQKRQLLKGVSEQERRVVSIASRMFPGAHIFFRDLEFTVDQEREGPFSLIWTPGATELQFVEYLPLQIEIEKERESQEKKG